MIPSRRAAFNAAWTEDAHQALLAGLRARTGVPIEFPIAETPVFLPGALAEELAATGAILTAQALAPGTLAAADAAVPERFRGPGEGAVPQFVQVDFGLVRDDDGRLHPKLVELQAFPSLYAFQLALGAAYRSTYALEPSLAPAFGGLDAAAASTLVRDVLVGSHDPEQVVLMEIAPETQKTRPDFILTEELWGVRTVDARGVIVSNGRLHYERDGRLVPITRVYNRVIPDELERTGFELPFDYRDDYGVDWGGHPGWYFRVSKISIPRLAHTSVPRTWFLHEVDELPLPPDRLILKPLFSFAGGGIVFGPDERTIAAIAPEARRGFILQERMAFAPAVETPDGGTQAEIRVMYVWADGPRAVLPLIRMGRGRMMGVDHNKGLRWVGASAAFIGD
ncbi:MAG: hypothetical protein AB7O67_15930 [Vicinamibacterales bacterium]